MMRRSGWIAAAALLALAPATAFAQTAPADPLAPGAGAEPAAAPEKPEPAEKPAARRAPRPAREGPAFAVTVHNDRSVGLVELHVGPAGEGEPKKVLGPLAFGRKFVIHVRKSKDCLYDIVGKFADDADLEQKSVDLCKDKAINLTD